MKTKLLTAVCALAIILGGTAPVSAADDNSLEILADAAIVRPGSFAVTIVGSVLFVAVLPIAATSKSVHKTAKSLVVNPAKATFTRPLGDFTSLKE
jgi:hypothetical protein